MPFLKNQIYVYYHTLIEFNTTFKISTFSEFSAPREPLLLCRRKLPVLLIPTPEDLLLLLAELPVDISERCFFSSTRLQPPRDSTASTLGLNKVQF